MLFLEALGQRVRKSLGALWTMAGVIAGLRRTDALGAAQVCIDRQRAWTIGYEIVKCQVHSGRRRS